jgi:hypothetical protein
MVYYLPQLLLRALTQQHVLDGKPVMASTTKSSRACTQKEAGKHPAEVTHLSTLMSVLFD